MEAGERKTGRSMVEGSPLPAGRGVTVTASCREAGSRVVGISGLIEILQMAARAIHRRAGKLTVRVTLIARHINMSACECELGCGVVIELCAAP